MPIWQFFRQGRDGRDLLVRPSRIPRWISFFIFRLCEVLSGGILIHLMHELKSAILAIFQTGPGWPCPISAALWISNILFALGSYEFLAMLEGKTRKGLFF